jgi:two-component system, chemotaxis family, protein-glutamate methylesterase/glutaminase
LTGIISADPRLEVIAAVSDPFAAAERLRHMVPDVIILDVEMPRMDGLTFLRKLMAQHPLPVVICSSLVAEKSETYLAAMAAGAIDVIAKPELGVKQFLAESAVRICDTLQNAARARVGVVRDHQIAPKLTAAAMLAAPGGNGAMLRTTEKIIAIGASTGGTEALRVLLEAMPRDCPPIVIVQHMPENFTAAFAQRLDSLCAVYHVEVKDGPLVSRHKPSVDVLFRSVARYAGRNAIGVIMTGMGDDGARGLREMRDNGASTFGQNEASCVVYGMPKEAKARGAVEQELALSQIPGAILRGRS